jgi:hypothetical protein
MNYILFFIDSNRQKGLFIPKKGYNLYDKIARENTIILLSKAFQNPMEY